MLNVKWINKCCLFIEYRTESGAGVHEERDGRKTGAACVSFVCIVALSQFVQVLKK